MTTIISGATNKPISSDALRGFFQTHNTYDGYLYIGYPIIGTADGAFPIDALWISKAKGIVAFALIEGKDISNYEDAQDDYANKIEAKLKGYKQLVEKRHLCVEINIVTFAPHHTSSSITTGRSFSGSFSKTSAMYLPTTSIL